MAYKTQFAKIKEKRGTLEGLLKNKIYKPYIKGNDINSKGQICRLFLPEIQVVCLSRIERRAYMLLVWDNDVIAVYSQFALPLEDTVDIANRLNIRHPTILENGNTIPSVRTIDFMVLYKIDGKEFYKAFTVKMASDLKKSVLKKFLIEQAICHIDGIEYKIVTESAINNIKADNIYVCYLARWWAENNNIDNEMIDDMTFIYHRLLTECNNDCLKTCQQWESYYHLSVGQGIGFAKYLIFNKKLSADMNKPLIFERAKIYKQGDI
jgi:hypothetical protein